MKPDKNNPLVKKKHEFPHSIVITMWIMVFAVILTYIVPSGAYDRVVVDGRSIVDPESFHWLEQSPVGIFDMFLAISKGMQNNSWVVFMILLIGGSFEVINSTGALTVAMAKIVKKYADRSIIMVPLTLLIFSILGCVMSLQEVYIAFAPLVISFSRALGFDALTGVAMLVLGQMIGFTAGEFNAFAVGTAQGVVGLPLYSGVEYRLVIHVIFYLISIGFVWKYAKKTYQDPSASYCYEAEVEAKKEKKEISDINFTTKHKIVLLILLLGFIGVGYISMNDMDVKNGTPAIFVIMAILVGILYGYSPNEIVRHFIVGAKNSIVGALIVGLSSSITVCLDSGCITDTIVYAACSLFIYLPKALAVNAIYVFTAGLNFLIGSGSGKAVLLMPILSPIGDILDIRQQLLVIAYSFGDGITNLISPRNPLVMASLAAGACTFGQWCKYIGKIVLVQLIASAIILSVLTYMNVGPF